MRWMAMLGLFVAAGCPAQEPAPPKTSTVGQAEAPAAQKQSITVPAGTRVPVALTYSVWSKTAHAGDAVHAVTAFPVTVGTIVAIPAGTYVEGVIDKVRRRASADHPALQIHFTRLLYANGYAVPLESAPTEVSVWKRSANLSAAVTRSGSESRDPLPGSQSWMSDSFAAQQPPPLQPLPRLGPNPAVVAGVGTAALVGLLVTVFALGHHRGDYTMLDAGSQIDMVLQSPLNLDGDQIAAALASAH